MSCLPLSPRCPRWPWHYCWRPCKVKQEVPASMACTDFTEHWKSPTLQTQWKECCWIAWKMCTKHGGTKWMWVFFNMFCEFAVKYWNLLILILVKVNHCYVLKLGKSFPIYFIGCINCVYITVSWPKYRCLKALESWILISKGTIFQQYFMSMASFKRKTIFMIEFFWFP